MSRSFVYWEWINRKASVGGETSNEKEKGDFFCQRCNSIILDEWYLPIGAYYCRSACWWSESGWSELYTGPTRRIFQAQDVLKWHVVQLAPFSEGVRGTDSIHGRQARANFSSCGDRGWKRQKWFIKLWLRWLIGWCMCLASPRIDVCLELYKRLQDDFACDISLLHGESEPYFRTPLVVATTHQLLKFYQAFWFTDSG